MKKFLSLFLAAAMAVSLGTGAAADEQSDLQQYVKEHVAELHQWEAELQELAGRRAEVNAQINQMNADMVDVLVEIKQAEVDIDTTSKRINKTSRKIVKTKKKLDAAKEDRDKQYDEMKKRIQYIYENGGDAGWTIMVLEAEDIESLLNRAEYAEEIQEADRAALKSLKKTVKVRNRWSRKKLSWMSRNPIWKHRNGFL